MRTWLERVGLTILGVGAYVVWGLLDGYDVYTLILIPLVLGTLVGFLLLGLSLSEKVSGPVLALVYVAALAGVGGLAWLTTKEVGMVAAVTVFPGILGLFFLGAGLSEWRESRRRYPYPFPEDERNGPAA
jgi:hypothetical protein